MSRCSTRLTLPNRVENESLFDAFDFLLDVTDCLEIGAG